MLVFLFLIFLKIFIYFCIVGNKFTLETRPNQEGVDVRQELLKFHSTYYSSNLMAVCVLGRGKNTKLIMGAPLSSLSHQYSYGIT